MHTKMEKKNRKQRLSEEIDRLKNESEFYTRTFALLFFLKSSRLFYQHGQEPAREQTPLRKISANPLPASDVRKAAAERGNLKKCSLCKGTYMRSGASLPKVS